MSAQPVDVLALMMELQSLPRYDASIAGGCECCGSWVEHDEDPHGDWIKYGDLVAAIQRASGGQP